MSVETAHPPAAVAAPPAPGILRIVFLVVVVLAVFAGLTYLGLQARANQATVREGTATAVHTDKPRVLTVKADPAPEFVDQVLPGNAAPYLETSVYSRATGLLKERFVDTGDKLKAGQLLAVIDSPEVDAQLLQAAATLKESEATRDRARANEGLARANLGRYDRVSTPAISQQERDEAAAALKVATASIAVAEATIVANQANVDRLKELQGFQRITAKFDGVVTTRNPDFNPGALVVADSSAARELFHLAQNDTLRVSTDVPQVFATSVKDGQTAAVFRREAPGIEYAGKVARTAHAVDPRTRTLRVEVEVPNPDGKLLPGMYLQVRFRLDSPSSVVRVPGAAVIVRAEGSKVAIVDGQGTIRYRPVVLGRDFGTMIEVISGLKGGEQLVVRPGDDLPEGTAVEAVASKGTSTP